MIGSLSDPTRQVVAAALIVSTALVALFGAPVAPVLIGCAVTCAFLLLRNRRKPIAS